MVIVLSRLLAVLFTIALALCLYPICAIFWFFGLLGNISSVMFDFTNRAIKRLWEDIRNSSEDPNNAAYNNGGYNNAGYNNAGYNNAGYNNAEFNNAGVNDTVVNDSVVNDVQM